MVWLITWFQSIYPTLGYVFENTPSHLDQRRKSMSTTRWSTLPWRAASTRCGTMRFLCALAVQLVDQPCTTLSSIVGFEIHHQKPQLARFSHIGWLKLLPTSYKARETSLVSYEHNRKTKRCFAHLYLLPMNTHLSRRWTKHGLSSCFNHLRWTKPKRNRKAYGVAN